LRYGTHIHSALALRAATHPTSFNESAQLEALSFDFSRDPCEIEEWRNAANAAKVLQAYNRKYHDEPFTVLQHNGSPMIELSFACVAGVIDGVTIVYSGRIDLVAQSERGVFVLDHKTTSMLGDTFWQDMAVSDQMRGYCWALRESDQTKVEPTGYIVDAICTRESITRAVYDDLVGDFVMVAEGGKPSKSKAVPVELERRTFYTKEPPKQLEEWHTNFMMKTEVWLWMLRKGRFPMNRANHCVGRYGLCDYYSVCELPHAQRADALASGAFKDNEWSAINKPNKEKNEK
jgi:hypothetical protein